MDGRCFTVPCGSVVVTREGLPVSKTRTTTVIRTRTEADVALRNARLSSEEEKVLRMRYGIAHDEVAPLQSHEVSQPEVAAQLAELEQRTVAQLTDRVDATRAAWANA